MSQTRIFLDTNILVYAHDAASQYHKVSADLLTAAIARQFQAVLAEQNLVELYRILTNPVAMKGKPLSAAQAKELIENIYLNGVWVCKVVCVKRGILHWEPAFEFDSKAI